MPLQIRALILLTLLLWQVMSVLSPVSVGQRALENAHAALHLQVEDHHHHNDGSLHLEAAEAPHAHADSNAGSSALPPAPAGGVHGLQAAGPVTVAPPRLPCPYLDGPLRPPRAEA